MGMLLVGAPANAGAREILMRVGDVDVPAGIVLHGDAVAIAGTLDVEGTVEGDAVAVGGDVVVGGQVGGAVRAVGGNVFLRSTAVVEGPATAWGGRVHVEPGAALGGRLPAPRPPGGPFGREAPFPGLWWWVWPHGLVVALGVVRWLALLTVLGGFVLSAWLMAVLFPGPLGHLTHVLERSPGVAFGMGLLGWALLGPVAAVLILSVVGLGLLVLLPAALVVALLFGVGAVAVAVGRRIREAGLPTEALVGSVVLAMAFAVPRLGWIVVAAVNTWGLGVVLLAAAERARRVPPPPVAAPPPPG